MCEAVYLFVKHIGKTEGARTASASYARRENPKRRENSVLSLYRVVHAFLETFFYNESMIMNYNVLVMCTVVESPLGHIDDVHHKEIR